MGVKFVGYPDLDLVYLSRSDVVACSESVDMIAVVRAALRRHALGETELPAESYLGWRTPSGAMARSLAMPGALGGAGDCVLGLKVINGNATNPARGLARSQGLVLLFDQEVAYPRVIMEAAYISALRTAAVTAVAAQQLGRPDSATVALLGCGTLARAHLSLLPRAVPGLRRVTLYDRDAERSRQLAADVAADNGFVHASIEVVDSARNCVADADLVVTVTTTDAGYLPYAWLPAGALVSHVSLDDLAPDVIERCDLLVVDDWDLVSHDSRRLLGRLYRQGRLRAPDGTHRPDAGAGPHARRVDTTLPDLVAGHHPGRRDPDDVIVVNPFGMAILDIAAAAEIIRVATDAGIGRRLPV